MNCHTCAHLDRTHKITGSTGHYIYGCNCGKRKTIVGHLQTDTELKTMGCSDFKKSVEVEQTSLF